jgi:hypothetical protein
VPEQSIPIAPISPNGYICHKNTSRVQLLPSGVLSLRDVSFDDSGVYNCISPDINGSISFNLTVYHFAYVVNGTAGFEATNGSTQIISCYAKGNPPITTYLWKKNGQPISSDNPHIRQLGANYIQISPVTPEDVGEYECIPQSVAGTHNTSKTQLDVRIFKSFDWIRPHYVKIFPNVSDGYKCIPRTKSFNVTSSGHFLTRGLKLTDEKLYCCFSDDIKGILSIDLSVIGYKPLKPQITQIEFTSDLKYMKVDWTDVARILRPVTNYTLVWTTEPNSNDNNGLVDRQTSSRPSGNATTNSPYHILQFNRRQIYTFQVYAFNDAGDGPISDQETFDVEIEYLRATQFVLAPWWIALIVIVCILLCCICCLCCLICICCLCGRRRKRIYYAEEKERRYSTELAKYRKGGADDDDDSDGESDSSSEGPIEHTSPVDTEAPEEPAAPVEN